MNARRVEYTTKIPRPTTVPRGPSHQRSLRVVRSKPIGWPPGITREAGGEAGEVAVDIDALLQKTQGTRSHATQASPEAKLHDLSSREQMTFRRVSKQRIKISRN